MRYYIASPGFNEEELNKIHKVEEILKQKCEKDDVFSFFSPFTDGGKLELDKNEDLNKLRVKLLFDENIEQIRMSSSLIALVDDYDKGTSFEIGYFIGIHLNYDDNWRSKLLLIGDKSDRISNYINRALHVYKSLQKSGLKFTVVDISHKLIEDYIFMGLCYANNILVVTWSDIPLESNLMTACCTYLHYQVDKNKYARILSASELLYTLTYDESYWTEIFGYSMYQLSNMKFANKME